jgi:hypothetical protein
MKWVRRRMRDGNRKRGKRRIKRGEGGGIRIVKRDKMRMK